MKASIIIYLAEDDHPLGWRLQALLDRLGEEGEDTSPTLVGGRWAIVLEDLEEADVDDVDAATRGDAGVAEWEVFWRK